MRKLISIIAVVLITIGAIAQTDKTSESKEVKAKAKRECCSKEGKHASCCATKSATEDWYISPVKGKCPQCTTPVTKEGNLLCKYEPESCKKCKKKM